MPISLVGGVTNGEPLSGNEIIGKITRGEFIDPSYAPMMIGLFFMGYLINMLITLLRFRREKAAAMRTQALALLGTFVAIGLFSVFFVKVITVFLWIIGIFAVFELFFSKQTRTGALWTLSYWIRGKEDRMTSEQKRAVHDRALEAAMNQDKDEMDTSDIDQIMNDYDRD